MSGAIRFADYDVCMHDWLAILLHDIARKREHLNPFLNTNLLIALESPVKKAEIDFAERPNGLNCASAKRFALANSNRLARTSSPLPNTTANVLSPFSS